MNDNSEIVYAIHNFQAENEDELTFCSGEPIIVLQKDDGFNDGWWQVYKMKKGHNQIHTHMLFFFFIG